MNPAQALFYVDNSVPIKDIYPSINYQTGQRILVFIVDRFESAKAYNRWKKLQGKRFVCRNIKEIKETNYFAVLDVSQVIYYLDHKLLIKKIQPVMDPESGKPRLAFYFDQEEHKEIYEQWLSMNSK